MKTTMVMVLKMEYDDLIEMAESKIKILDKVFDESNIPDQVPRGLVGELELQIRKLRYNL